MYYFLQCEVPQYVTIWLITAITAAKKKPWILVTMTIKLIRVMLSKFLIRISGTSVTFLLLNIDDPYFEGMVNYIYPPKLLLNEANTTDTKPPFLDFFL